AGALGDLAARLFLLAARRFFFGALLRVLLLATLGFDLFGAAPHLVLGALLGLDGGAFLFLAAAIGLDQRRATARLDIGLRRILDRAHTGGGFLGRQGPRRPSRAAYRLCRRGRSRRRRRRLSTGDRRARLIAG